MRRSVRVFPRWGTVHEEINVTFCLAYTTTKYYLVEAWSGSECCSCIIKPSTIAINNTSLCITFVLLWRFCCCCCTFVCLFLLLLFVCLFVCLFFLNRLLTENDVTWTVNQLFAFDLTDSVSHFTERLIFIIIFPSVTLGHPAHQHVANGVFE